MSAAINAALFQRFIRRKMVYARQTGLNGSENTRADAKTEHTRCLDPKNYSS